MKHKLKITQVFKATREIVVDVEAESGKQAVELVQEELGGPAFEDPRWVTHWDLQNEEIIWLE